MNHFYELETEEMKLTYKYYGFVSWLIEEDWEPYWIGNEMYINTSDGNKVRSVYTLWLLYLKSLPEEINDII